MATDSTANLPVPETRRNPNSSVTITTSASSRPTSAWTNDSLFADSAVDMDVAISAATADEATEDKVFAFPPSSSPDFVDHTLSDKMRQLAATAWALEQDDGMTSTKQKKLHAMLTNLEQSLEGEEETSVQDDETKPVEAGAERDTAQPHVEGGPEPDTRIGDKDEEDEWIDEADLLLVRDHLVATVSSLRLRQQEQRHLHELTLHKLEAVAQRCVVQEQQMQDWMQEMQNLRGENQTLGQENDRLRETVCSLESESVKKEIAVSAMTSAVAGLEGWIDAEQKARSDQTYTPQTRRGKQPRMVMRGKGRFRGRYYVDDAADLDDPNSGYGMNGAGNALDLQEGVKAWLRGFRDVEEELRQSCSPGSIRSKEMYREPNMVDEDEWGEFQEPRQLFT